MSRHLVGAMLACLLVSACIPVPANRTSRGSRDNVSESTTRFIEVRKTTRTQVLLALGEPDSIKAEESEYIYRRTRDTVIGVILSTSGGGRDPALLQKDIWFSIGFDPKGVVSYFNTRSETH